jgi:hypothetical protein
MRWNGDSVVETLGQLYKLGVLDKTKRAMAVGNPENKIETKLVWTVGRSRSERSHGANLCNIFRFTNFDVVSKITCTFVVPDPRHLFGRVSKQSALN